MRMISDKLRFFMALVLVSLFLLTTVNQGHALDPSEDTGLICSNSSSKAGAYHTYPEMTILLKQLQTNHSDIMKVTSLGKTYQGRDIWGVKLSDNVELDEIEEPGVLLLGAHHGNEKPSFETLIYFIQYMVETYTLSNVDNDGDGTVNEDIIDGLDNDGDGLVDEDPSEDRVREVLDSREIYLVPMVNPDGVDANTRKNCAPNHGPFGLRNGITSYGVDLNRNYGYKWWLYYLFPRQFHFMRHLSDLSFNYRGEHPFSENETQAVKQFVEAHENIRISLSYHSYGEFMFYPWTHTSRGTPDEQVFHTVAEAICDINGYRLYTGRRDYIIPRIGGSLGTSENWLYGVHGILSYTVELCETRAPEDPAVILEFCRIHAGVNLFVAEVSSTVETVIPH